MVTFPALQDKMRQMAKRAMTTTPALSPTPARTDNAWGEVLSSVPLKAPAMMLALATQPLANAAILQSQMAHLVTTTTPAPLMISATMASAKALNASVSPAINATMPALAAQPLANAAILTRPMAHPAIITTPAPLMINAIMASVKALQRTALLLINATCLAPAVADNAALPPSPMDRLAMITTHAPLTISATMANAEALNANVNQAINATLRALATHLLANVAILPRLALAMTTTRALLTTSATMVNAKALLSPVLNPINVICLALAIVVLANAPILPRLAPVMIITDAP